MARGYGLKFLSFLLLAVYIFIATKANQTYRYPFPPLSEGLSTPGAGLIDFWSGALGIRRLAADLAWIQTLQYYGEDEENQPENEAENGMGHYGDLLSHCQHVIRIDPYFTYAYLYGASALGWNIGRRDEAEILLHEGLQMNPKEWRIPEYMIAMSYQKNNDIKPLMSSLEVISEDPDCPNLLRSILASLYKKNGLYIKAIHEWLVIYDTKDPSYTNRAVEEIQKLKPFLSSSRHPPLDKKTHI